jgi:hypothetical protein
MTAEWTPLHELVNELWRKSQMPRIDVQHPNHRQPTQPASSGGVRPLKRAGDVGKILASFYGEPKTGKTRLASTFPKPILFLATDDGTDSIAGTEGIDVFPINQPDDMVKATENLKSGRSFWRRRGEGWEQLPSAVGEPYATGVLDHATKLRNMLLLEILGLEEMPLKKPWGGKAMQNVWMPLAAQMQKYLRALVRLSRQEQLKNVVSLSQEQDLTHNEEGTAHPLPPDIGAALGKGVADWLDAECSYIGQTLVRPRVRVIEATGKMPRREVKENGVDYCLRVRPGDLCRAGMRVTPGIEINQDFLVNPTYDLLMSLIQGV